MKPVQQIARSLEPFVLRTDRVRLLLLFVAGVILLGTYGAFVLSFQRQRRMERRLETELFRYQSFVATIAPTVQGAPEMQAQLGAAHARLATARARLSVADEQVDVVQRVLQASRLHSVTVTQLEVDAEAAIQPATARGEARPIVNRAGPDIVEQRYDLGVRGPLSNVLTFGQALETDLLPAARLEEVAVERNETTDSSQADYTFSAVLIVLTTVDGRMREPTAPAATRAERLRADYEAALDARDYEHALSLLTRLSLITDESQDARFYETYVAYGDYLLERGLLDQAEEQYTNALALRPEGEEAIVGLLRVSEGRTETPAATAPAGTPTPTSEDGVTTAVPTPTPTSTFPPTQPLPPTNTPGPTDTPRPTEPVTPSSTPTITTTPTPTATPNPYQFGAREPVFLPNCGITMIKGMVETEDGQPLNGVTVRVWWDGAGPQQVYSLPSGTDPTKPNGYWDVVLASGPKVGKWYVNVVDRDTGKQLSEVITVNTDVGPCDPTGSGKQVVIVDFVRFAGAYGTPAPTSTATQVPTNTRTPTSTATTTATPTVTPTPTATPVRYEMQGGPIDIPDDVAITPLENAVTVSEDFPIRRVEVFVYIEHPDTYDLRIELISPYGNVFLLLEERRNQDGGPEGISRWFPLSGDDLERIEDKSSQGTWTLRVTDYKPIGTQGQLNSWILEVYP